MTVTSVKELIKRDGNYQGVHERITRAWQITVDSPYENSRTIGNQTIGVSLPVLFQSHPSNLFATARSLAITHHQGLIWQAKCEYSTEPITQSERERAEQPIPTERRVKISWSAASYDKVVVKDIDDKAVVNSAGDYYDPPPAVPWERLSFHFRKNFTTPDPWILQYLNSVNSTDISILGIPIAAGMARFTQPSGGEEQEENGQIYHETTWTIEADVNTWQLELLDEGFREISDTDRVNITDDDGNPITSPVLLDGAGAKLPEPSLNTAVFNNHKVYYEKNYLFLPGVDSGTGG